METKKWYSSKTMWIAIATSLVGILMAVSESIEVSGGDAGVLLSIVGVVNFILRYVTSRPIE